MVEISTGNTSEISTSNTPKSHDFQGTSSFFSDISLPEIQTPVTKFRKKTTQIAQTPVTKFPEFKKCANFDPEIFETLVLNSQIRG